MTPKHSRRPSRRSSRRQTLLPVMRPTFNMYETIKQLALMEDHLVHSAKRCPDCITKHGAIAEGLCEESKALCSAGNRETQRLAAETARAIRVIRHAWAQDPHDPRVSEAAAAALRQLRKKLVAAGHGTLPVESLPDNEAHEVSKFLRAAKKLKPRGRSESTTVTRRNGRSPLK